MKTLSHRQQTKFAQRYAVNLPVRSQEDRKARYSAKKARDNDYVRSHLGR